MKRVIVALRVLALIALVALLIVPIFAGPTPVDSNGVVNAPTPSIPGNISVIIPWLLFALSEMMSLIPSWKTNGILQFIISVLTKLGKKEG